MAVDTSPDSGQGCCLSVCATQSGTYTPLLLLQDDAEFSGFENATIEIKPLLSGYVMKIAGRTDSGSFTGASYLVMADAGVAMLFSLFTSKANVFWKFQLPDGSTKPSLVGSTLTAGTGTTFAFVGFVGTCTPGNFTGEDTPSLDLEIPISGPVTITAAS